MDMPTWRWPAASTVPQISFFCWTWPTLHQNGLPVFARFSPLAICGTCIPNATSGIGCNDGHGCHRHCPTGSAALVSAAVIIRRIEEALPVHDPCIAEQVCPHANPGPTEDQ